MHKIVLNTIIFVKTLLAGQPSIVVFKSHVMVYFWPNRHNFGDIELKFVFYHDLHTTNKPPNLKSLAFLYLTFL